MIKDNPSPGMANLWHADQTDINFFSDTRNFKKKKTFFFLYISSKLNYFHKMYTDRYYTYL